MFEQTETKEMKKALVAEFAHPFSVRRDRGTASHWIRISWQDGPPESLVRQFTGKFNDTARDDIMTDLWCGGQYTAESRECSLAAYRWAVRQIEIEFNVEIKVTVQDSWRENGEKTGYIKQEDDLIVDPDCNDGSQRYVSNKVNRKVAETDFRGIELSGFELLPGESPATPEKKEGPIIIHATRMAEIHVKQDVPPKTKVEASAKKEALYERLREGGRYNGLPKAATFWKEVLDVTSGLGIRPYLNPGGGWLELEEFQAAVPVILRNYKNGAPPDEVAHDLELEGGDQELYEKLRQDAHARPEEPFEQVIEEESEISLGLELEEICRSQKGGGLEVPVYVKPEIKNSFSFSTSKDVYQKMKGYQKADRETFLLLLLNAKNVVIGIETHSVGTVNTAAVYPAQVFRSVLMKNACALICVHNHPSGDFTPSLSDRQITKELVLCAQALQVVFLDHIILGDDGYFSFGDEGLITDYLSFATEKLAN